MENREINITWCYPDILSLHGDRGNIMALKRIAEMLGLNVAINKVESYRDKIDFENTDILFFTAGELKAAAKIAEVLKEQAKEMAEFIEKEKVAVAVGTTGIIFAKETQRLGGEIIKGLGLLDMNCRERELVYGDDLVFRLAEDREMEINGSQIQMVDTELNGDIALGHIEYGHGNNGGNLEGAKYKNLIFTNALGPVLVKNPWYGEKLIRIAMKNKGIEIDAEITDGKYEIEKKSMDCIKQYIEKKQKK